MATSKILQLKSNKDLLLSPSNKLLTYITNHVSEAEQEDFYWVPKCCRDIGSTPNTVTVTFSGVTLCEDKSWPGSVNLNTEWMLTKVSAEYWTYNDVNWSIYYDADSDGDSMLYAFDKSANLFFSSTITGTFEEAFTNDLAIGDCSAFNYAYDGSASIIISDNNMPRGISITFSGVSLCSGKSWPSIGTLNRTWILCTRGDEVMRSNINKNNNECWGSPIYCNDENWDKFTISWCPINNFDEEEDECEPSPGTPHSLLSANAWYDGCSYERHFFVSAESWFSHPAVWPSICSRSFSNIFDVGDCAYGIQAYGGTAIVTIDQD